MILAISHIEPYDLLTLASCFIGATVALLLALTKRSGQTANRFLSMAIIVGVIQINGVSFGLPILGPLLYFYVLKLTNPAYKFRRIDYLNYCPLLAAYWLPAWLCLLPVFVYLYLAHRAIQSFYDQLQPILMDKPRYAFRHLDRELWLISLACLAALFNAAFFFPLALMLIVMAATAIITPFGHATFTAPVTDKSDAKEKSRRLKEAVVVNRLYEDADLTLATLAFQLKMTTHELSAIINLGLGKNFNDFVNEFRVREIIRKMHDESYDRLTLLGIALESGFNSKRTFNRVFKEMTSKTPVEYKNVLKKGGPSYQSVLSLYLEQTQLWPFDHYSGKPLIMVWSLSTVHKAYREKCRSELTDWAAVNVDGFTKLLDLVFGCGDAQIQEDLCTVMLGLSAKFTKADDIQRLLAGWILDNIFSDDAIVKLTNSVVRYGARSYMERIYSFGLCTEQEIQKCRPPYRVTERMLELDFTKNEHDSSFEGRYPIQDDLGWYVIDNAFKGFLHYENGGLDVVGREFMKPYFSLYDIEFNQHGFVVAAAIKYLKKLGWNKTEGSAHDGSKDWATFEEKYTWLAVHNIQGFLADRLPYGDAEDSEPLQDYGKILHVPNPVDFGVGHIVYYYNTGIDRWLLPEDIAEQIPLTPSATLDDIKRWATLPFVPDFKKWIELKELHWGGRHEGEDNWLTLYSTTALPDPSNVGRARLTLNCVLIPEIDFLEFKDFIENSENSFESSHSMRPDEMSASFSNGPSHSLVDVIWMDKYDEDEPDKWIVNQDGFGYEVKCTIAELHEFSIAKATDIYQVPSLLLRKALQIKTTDKRGFFDANEKLKVLMCRRWEDDNTEQKITLVDRKSFTDFLQENSLVPIWIAENFRSTIAESKNKSRDDHWQNCSKWIVWPDYSSFQFHNDSHC